MTFVAAGVSRYIVSVFSLDFLSTVVLNLALVLQRLICYSSALLLRRHTETSHLSPVDFHTSFGCKSPTTYMNSPFPDRHSLSLFS
ncbi:hypothetical protein PoB_003163000 [Plakobranchus ocellatus]|uniref:Uncharacterized protein n=1 Tax=Plakobranchus ocellatus TaxID=259542 RepID=A0AAV4AAC7_9GAST|nr:hypothetical protein PoB_003163000 [Plakobranchus ocellatus]